MAALKKSFILQTSIAGVVAFFGWSNAATFAQVVSAAEDPSLAAPTVAMASPTTAPADSSSVAPGPDAGRDERGGFRGRGWFGGGQGLGGGGAGGQSPLADIPDGAEWKQASSFMVDHSPHRWRYYNRLEGPRQQGMMRFITKAFRGVQKAQTDNPALAVVMIQRIEAEDAVFGVVMDIRQARRNGDLEKAKSFTPDLTTKVTSLVDASFKERQLRVDTLQKTLDDLKTHLDADEKHRDSVIAARVQALTTPHMGPPGLGDATGTSPEQPGDASHTVTVGLTVPHDQER